MLINLGQTRAKLETVKFRQKSRTEVTDILYFARLPLVYLNRFPHFELLYFANGRSFTGRYRRPALAIWAIKVPYHLPLATALGLFDIKEASIAAYNMWVILEDFTLKNLEQLHCVKASYFPKGVLKVYTQNRLVYLLADPVLLCENLGHRFELTITEAFNINLRNWMQRTPRDKWEFLYFGCNEQ